MSNAVLLHGDCLEMLRQIEDNSVDSLVTDPPAGISFMGKSGMTIKADATSGLRG